MDDSTFPLDFMCISNRPFKWVFENRKDFVNFTVNEMESPTGLFLKWKQYCLRQKKRKNKT